jgi:hypothetical protein
VTSCDTSQQVYSVRRYYLLESLAADLRGEEAMADLFRQKQQSVPGTALADDFPSKSLLASAGYTTIEDVNGADAEELECAELTPKQAQAALSAIAALLT